MIRMLSIKCFFFIILFFICHIVISQSIEISGQVETENDVENIHVINKTAQVFTVTNIEGEFKISARLNDTLLFTSIQHKTKSIVISEAIVSTKRCVVVLEELVNELHQVTIGKLLSGDLNADIRHAEGDPPISFYDVGIPGYKGKPATQSERRLNEATTGGGFIPLNPILNAISGRTKMLKEHISLEKNDNLLHKIKINLSEDFFSSYQLDENLHADFFYFCEEDPDFILRCKNKSDIEVFEFLKEKLLKYKQNLNVKKE